MIEKKNLQAPDFQPENGSTSFVARRWSRNGWTLRRAPRVEPQSLETFWPGWLAEKFLSKSLAGPGRQRCERVQAEATRSCIGLMSASMAISLAMIPSRPATTVPHENSCAMHRRSSKLNRETTRSIDDRRRVWCQLETTRPGKERRTRLTSRKWLPLTALVTLRFEG